MAIEVKYTLMNKNRPVLEFTYDMDDHLATKITDVHDLRYAPPAVVDPKGNATKRTLNDWWRSRAIPASRAQIYAILDNLNMNSTLALAEKSFGLSLSDRYWINDSSNPQRWEDINFFDNDFTDDLGVLTLGQSSSDNPNLMSPNATLNGDLRKKWTIANGERILVKEGSGFVNQEVYNEVIATRLFQRLLEPGEYVPYSFHTEGRRIYCACPNLLGDDEELITAWDIIVNKKKPNNLNDYQFFVATLEELGVPRAEEALTKMFTCDYILANEDRHWRNFGVVRNVETLEYMRMAPIFDTGTCLWCRSNSLSMAKDYEYVAKPFGSRGMRPDRQLELFRNYGWFEPEKLEGFSDEAMEILAQNENIPPKRLDQIRSGLERNIRMASDHAVAK